MRGNSRTLRHGHDRKGYKSPEYMSWDGMIQRCTNMNAQNFARYGGAGVAVCNRWLSFKNFLADMGERPEGTTLGRILDMGDYEPGNAFWMTDFDQRLAQKNKRALVKRKVMFESGWMPCAA